MPDPSTLRGLLPTHLVNAIWHRTGPRLLLPPSPFTPCLCLWGCCPAPSSLSLRARPGSIQILGAPRCSASRPRPSPSSSRRAHRASSPITRCCRLNRMLFTNSTMRCSTCHRGDTPAAPESPRTRAERLGSKKRKLAAAELARGQRKRNRARPRASSRSQDRAGRHHNELQDYYPSEFQDLCLTCRWDSPPGALKSGCAAVICSSTPSL